MPNFTFKRIEEIVGRESFWLLVKDGVCEVEDFEEALEANANVRGEIETIHHRMQLKARGENILRTTMYRALKSTHPDAFEFKSKHLRYYGIQVPSIGKVIIMCSFKEPNDKRTNEFLKKNLAPRIQEFINASPELYQTEKKKKK